MAYSVIPQVEFDRAVQKVMTCGIARVPAENVVQSLWQASVDLEQNFRQLIDKATVSNKLNVEQVVLDRINKNKPGTVRYNKKVPPVRSSIVGRELRYNEYYFVTEDGTYITSEDDKLLAWG